MGCIMSIHKKNKYKYERMDVGKGKYVLKLIKNNEQQICKKINNIEKLINEVRIIKLLSSDKTIILKNYKLCEKYNYGYIYYEYIPGCDLVDFVHSDDYKNINYGSLIKMFQQMILCVEHCHLNNVIHLDLKLDNFICVNNNPENIKLIDFGLSKRNTKNNRLNNFCGTIPYTAPEIFRCVYFFESDIWSLACVFYCILFNKNIFPSDKFKSLIINLRESKYFNKIKINIKKESDPFFSEILLKMLIVNPKKRISIFELKKLVFDKN